MLTDYIQTVMQRAKYDLLEDGSYYGEIRGFRGVWAEAKSLEACRRQLQEVLEDWLVVMLQIGGKIPACRA